MSTEEKGTNRSSVARLSAMSSGPLESAASYFNSFHDGLIAETRFDEEGSLTLRIDILYLARRIAPTMRSFYLTLADAVLPAFESWEDEDDREATLLPEQVLNQSCEILSAEVKNDFVLLILNQPNSQLDYSGATMHLSSTGVTCRDELGNSYTTAAIDDLAASYWKEWSS